MKTFSQVAWEQNSTTFLKIVKHPFNQKLKDGSLSPTLFQRYKEQDAYYLFYFTKCITKLALLANNHEELHSLLTLAIKCLSEDLVEQNLHDNQLTSANKEYTAYLFSLEEKEVLAAALLPCFWIYLELASVLGFESKQNNPYNSWIDFYTSTDYRGIVCAFKDYVDSLQYSKFLPQMEIAFQKSFDYEYRFWDEIIPL
jgi:thiaminase/transcriptional activator TenA